MIGFLQCRNDKSFARASRDDVSNKAHDIIKAWDVRQVGQLRELFPHLFPHSLSRGKLIAGMHSNSDWLVEKQ